MSTRKQPPSGLGRGLAGILDDVYATERAPEVAGLLGLVDADEVPAVRRLVTDLAVGAIVDGFDADGVVLAHRPIDERTAEPTVTADLPAGWRSVDGPGFGLAGRLWAEFDGPDSESEPRTDDVGGTRLWIDREDARGLRLAVGVLRSAEIGPREVAPLRKLLRSVVAALTGEQAALPAGRTVAADVDRPTEERASEAVAWLAEPCSVAFAGQSDVAERRLSVVVLVDERDGAPLVGLSVDPPDDTAGPARAVLGAAASVGIGFRD